jgi:hypothetical protein
VRYLLLVAFLPSLAFAQDLRTQDEITVERILIDTRVTDYSGDPILELTKEDFEVRVGGKRATLESVEWIPETAVARVLAGLDDEELDAPPPGRLFIYFVQTDFARNSVRVTGHMKFMTYVEQMIEALEENDRVAVFSFDSHLKFRLDFTSDKTERQDRDHPRDAAGDRDRHSSAAPRRAESFSGQPYRPRSDADFHQLG